ncbi:MAG: hypothetical protein HN487_03320 [Flavobacterium sp.]|jgi:hypothetical protein|nr:hypothetical protein [Flavobacterium sp.]
MSKHKSSFLVMLFLLLNSTSMYSQCAMCKAVVENGDVTMAEGINDGITYLMVFPYILVGVLFYFIYKNKKRVKN